MCPNKELYDTRKRKQGRKSKFRTLKSQYERAGVVPGPEVVEEARQIVGDEGINEMVSLSKRGININNIKSHFKVKKKNITPKQISNVLKVKGTIAAGENLDLSVLHKKIFFNFIGGWYFDLICNRKYTQNTEDKLLKYFGTFLHGNSGWVKAYEMDAKNEDECNRVVRQFISDCQHLEIQPGKVISYPVRKIVSDAESGLKPDNFHDVKIQKITQRGTGHLSLARINAFASSLRKHVPTKYITAEDFNYFANLWNEQTIPNILCARYEMLEKREFEEAYIAGCLYMNEEAREGAKDLFQIGDGLQIREDNDRSNDYGQVLKGTYEVVGNEDGMIKLVNIDDENDVRTISPAYVKKRAIFNRNDIAKDYQYTPPLNLLTPKVRTPAQEEKNKKEAAIYQNAKTVRGAREVITLNKGQDSVNERDKRQKEYNDKIILTQKQKEDAAKKFMEEEARRLFDYGILVNATPQERFNTIEKYALKMDPNVRDELFGTIEFFGPTRTVSNTKLKELISRWEYKKEHKDFEDLFNHIKGKLDLNKLNEYLGKLSKGRKK